MSSGRSSPPDAVRWDLSDLYEEVDELRADLADIRTEVEDFRDRYRGRLARLEASEWLNLLETYESLQDRAGRAYAYAYLNWSTDTNDETRGALLQEVRETFTRIRQQLVFVETEWSRLPEERARALIDDPTLEAYRHYLEIEYEKREHVLSEEEERVLSEKDLHGRSAWTRYFDETFGESRFELRGESLTQQQVLSRLYEPDRSLRRDAAAALTEGLEERKRTLTFIFNTILADRASEDRLREYDHWLASRNLDNEISDRMVEALVETVTDRYDLVGRFYHLKGRLLDLDPLMDYDRYAPIGSVDRRYDWGQARSVVLDAYGAFDDRMASIAERFFEERWIDAAPRPGKRGGAFSAGTVPSAHPYVLLNYTGQPRDVQTLAHELGHGVHQYLAREQGVLQADTPLTTAETASVFGEMLVFRRLLDREDDPRTRLTMLVQKIDDTVATVFRQVAMNRFEDRIHRARRSSGELTHGEFSRHWMETQRAMFDGSVRLGEHYRCWWSYVPHFLHTPGYVYAYAFGELLVLALYARYQREGDPFVEEYRNVLKAGGSDWPHALMERLGVDCTDPTFWQEGMEAVEGLIEEAEQTAAHIGTDPSVVEAQ